MDSQEILKGLWWIGFGYALDPYIQIAKQIILTFFGY